MTGASAAHSAPRTSISKRGRSSCCRNSEAFFFLFVLFFLRVNVISRFEHNRTFAVCQPSPAVSAARSSNVHVESTHVRGVVCLNKNGVRQTGVGGFEVDTGTHRKRGRTSWLHGSALLLSHHGRPVCCSFHLALERNFVHIRISSVPYIC